MVPSEELRFHLQETYRALREPRARIRLPRPQSFAPAPAIRGERGPEGHFHLRAELFLQCGAATCFRFPSETLELQPGEVLIVPPRVFHAESVAGSGPFLNVVLYAETGALTCHLATAGLEGRPQVAYPESLESSSCGRIAAWLEDAVRVGREFADSAVATDLVRSIVGLTLQLLDRPTPGHPEPLPVVRCRQMIHEDLGNPELSVATLAQRLGCSADYLSHLFRTIRGERLTAYIEELRLRRAAELLTETPLSCKEVAWASGYANQSYFIRCFRKRWGASPGEYRSRL